jgi:thiamine-monophosphate kinase
VSAERALTERLARFFPAGADAPIAIGDDAAVLTVRHENLVACCDPVVAGVHFTAAAPPALIGRKAVNRNLSDLAAMGAVPGTSSAATSRATTARSSSP